MSSRPSNIEIAEINPVPAIYGNFWRATPSLRSLH